MTYVVTEACIKCKFMDCVEVCPVDCFYEGENMLVIHPDECIDCGVCEPECPVDAIKADSDPGLERLGGFFHADPVQPDLAGTGRGLRQGPGAIEAGMEQPFVETAHRMRSAANPANGELGSGGGSGLLGFS